MAFDWKNQFSFFLNKHFRLNVTEKRLCVSFIEGKIGNRWIYCCWLLKWNLKFCDILCIWYVYFSVNYYFICVYNSLLLKVHTYFMTSRCCFFSTLNFIVTLSLIICDNILFLITLNSSGFFFLHITVPTSVGEI